MRSTLAATLSLLAACGGDDSDSAPSEPESLDTLALFADAVEQQPGAGILPYDVNAVLYADESEKLRFMSVPDGAARFDALDAWDYPDGTLFIKTFFFYRDARDPALGRRLLETRIIERQAGRWTGRTYLWNEAQTEARRHKVGRTLQVTWTNTDGDTRTQPYRVPNDNDCKTCHSRDHQFEPLGPRTRQLDRDYEYPQGRANQLDKLVELGWLRDLNQDAGERFKLAEPYGDQSLEHRARAYLDANCSHCHRPGGEAGSTALDLRAETEDLYSLGHCRSPVAAGPGSGGRRYDIVAGDPDASIIVFRMESTDPQLKMPELPTLTSDAQGTELIRAWIAAMQNDTSCN